MDILETLAKLGTQDTGQRRTKHNTAQKAKNDKQRRPNQNPGMDSCAREGYAVPASYE